MLVMNADFGARLARLRGARNLSQEELGRLAGLSRATIARAEKARMCTATAGTALMLIQGLAAAAPPITPDEALWLAAEAGLDRAAALALLPRESSDVTPRRAFEEAAAELARGIGLAPATRILEAITAALPRLTRPVKARRLAPGDLPGF